MWLKGRLYKGFGGAEFEGQNPRLSPSLECAARTMHYTDGLM